MALNLTDLMHFAPTLVQLPFVIAFIWFALRMANDYREDAKLRDSHWMEFLTVEREQRRSAMQQGFGEVEKITMAMTQMTESLRDLTAIVIKHDDEAKECHAKIMREKGESS